MHTIKAATVLKTFKAEFTAEGTRELTILQPATLQ
jgi:hypothetical protein